MGGGHLQVDGVCGDVGEVDHPPHGQPLQEASQLLGIVRGALVVLSRALGLLKLKTANHTINYLKSSLEPGNTVKPALILATTALHGLGFRLADAGLQDAMLCIGGSTSPRPGPTFSQSS